MLTRIQSIGEEPDSTLPLLHALEWQKNCSLRSKRRLVLTGDSADSIFYLQSVVKGYVVSANGKEATITLLFPNFIGKIRYRT